MASYQSEREDFIARMQAEGMPPEISRRILRHANTIQRLSAAECNGDYPCDNGERQVIACARCEAGYVPSVMTRGGRKPHPSERGVYVVVLICPNCRAQDLIIGWCAKASGAYLTAYPNGVHAGNGIVPFRPVFQGDPRGACVKLRVPSGQTDDAAQAGLCVPTRNY